MLNPNDVIRSGEQADQIMQDQRAEIARLRLTDAEREAVEWFSHFGPPQNGPFTGKHANSLRGLLERLGGGDE
jgi:hypothetical protein